MSGALRDPYALGVGLGALIVRVVEPGTVIRNEDGREETVDDTHAVQKGRDVYVTGATWTALKTAVDAR